MRTRLRGQLHARGNIAAPEDREHARFYGHMRYLETNTHYTSRPEPRLKLRAAQLNGLQRRQSNFGGPRQRHRDSRFF